jgi:hypothetical protein
MAGETSTVGTSLLPGYKSRGYSQLGNPQELAVDGDLVVIYQENMRKSSANCGIFQPCLARG